MKLLTILAIILTLLMRCQAKNENIPEENDEALHTMPAPPEQMTDIQEERSELRASNPKNYEEPPVVSTVNFNQPSILPEKVIRHAYLRMQVKDYAASTKALKNYISHRKAFISNAKEERTDGNLDNSLTIRVEDNNFESLLEDLQKESVYLEHKNINAKDVTEEFEDADTRLKTKKKVEERYLALLARANNVKDILAIETELKSLQEEIEASEGRQRYLQNQVAYSTITVDYFQTITPAISPDNTFIPNVVNALSEGWKICLSFIYGFIKLWPIWLLIILLIFFIQKSRKSRLTIIDSSTI